MEKDHFEILLEHIEGNTQMLAEGLVGVNQRLDHIESWQTTVENRLETIDRLEAGQQVLKSDVRDIKRNMGLLNSIANDHESRLQGVESQLKDHIENHS